MGNQHNLKKNQYMLQGKFKKKGYDWWWHSFTARDAETNEEKSFFIEFFIVNPKLMQIEPVIGNEIRKPSYLMIKCGTWGENPKQLHRFFSLKDVMLQRYPIHITAKDCYLSETELRGSVSVKKADTTFMTDAGRMQFDLKMKKEIAYNVGYGTSGLFRFLKAFQMYWHVEGMKTSYEGNIILDGRKYIVDPQTCYGYADKNWGSDFTSPWIWISSNHLIRKSTNEELENSAFDIGGGRPKAFFIPFKRKLLGIYYIDGKEYEFNFSKFWKRSKTLFQFDIKNDSCHWVIEQKNKDIKIVTKIECQKSEMLLIQYESPTGLRRHNKLWNGGTGIGVVEVYHKQSGDWQLVDELLCDHVGCEYGEFDQKKRKNEK